MTPSRRSRPGSSPASRRSLPRAASPAGPRSIAGLGPEAYRLQFDRDGVRLAASAVAGFRYGWITLGQILRGARLEAGDVRLPGTPASSTMRRASPSAAPISTSRGSSIRRTRSRASSTASPGTSSTSSTSISATTRAGGSTSPAIPSSRPWRRGAATASPSRRFSAAASRRYGGFYSADDVRVPRRPRRGARHRDRPRDRHPRPLPLPCLQAIPSLRDPRRDRRLPEHPGLPQQRAQPGGREDLRVPRGGVRRDRPALPRAVDPCRRRRGGARRLARLARWRGR